MKKSLVVTQTPEGDPVVEKALNLDKDGNVIETPIVVTTPESVDPEVQPTQEIVPAPKVVTDEDPFEGRGGPDVGSD
jgi:hypothetical protein